MKTFDRNFWISITIFSLIIGLICFLPYWLTRPSIFKWDFSDTGTIGDTIEGIMGPFIAVAASVLTFIAFWVQFKANEQQRKDIHIERFENKFYAMIEIHRNNVNEIILGQSLVGRKAFVAMFKELKFTYYLVHDYYNNKYKQTMPNDSISDEMLYNIVYIIFFFGVGPNSMVSPIFRTGISQS